MCVLWLWDYKMFLLFAAECKFAYVICGKAVHHGNENTGDTHTSAARSTR